MFDNSTGSIGGDDENIRWIHHVNKKRTSLLNATFK